MKKNSGRDSRSGDRYIGAIRTHSVLLPSLLGIHTPSASLEKLIKSLIIPPTSGKFTVEANGTSNGVAMQYH